MCRLGEGHAAWIRPLLGLSSKDLALYCRFQALQLPSLPTRPLAPSLLSLSANFVHGLDSQMPSAVASMLRTTEKLQVRV